jgi:hypothetical protein
MKGNSVASSFLDELRHLEGTRLGQLLVEIGQRPALSDDPSDAFVERAHAYCQELRASVNAAHSAGTADSRFEDLRVAGLVRDMGRVEKISLAELVLRLRPLAWGFMRFESRATKLAKRPRLRWPWRRDREP